MDKQVQISVEFSSDALWGSEDPEREGYDPKASEERFATLLRRKLEEDFPAAIIDIEWGINDRHSYDGATDTPEAAEVGAVIDAVYQDFEWIVKVSHE